MSRCRLCERELIPLDISYSKKFFGRGTETYVCRTCIGREFSLTDEQMEELAARWKADGCALFQFD